MHTMFDVITIQGESAVFCNGELALTGLDTPDEAEHIVHLIDSLGRMLGFLWALSYRDISDDQLVEAGLDPDTWSWDEIEDLVQETPREQ